VLWRAWLDVLRRLWRVDLPQLGGREHVLVIFLGGACCMSKAAL
jgi:hypothetical protein